MEVVSSFPNISTQHVNHRNGRWINAHNSAEAASNNQDMVWVSQ